MKSLMTAFTENSGKFSMGRGCLLLGLLLILGPQAYVTVKTLVIQPIPPDAWLCLTALAGNIALPKMAETMKGNGAKVEEVKP